VAALAPVALDLGDGEAGNADLAERVAHVVELERLDDGDDEFHELPHGGRRCARRHDIMS
jgi:hypothetical protein